MAVQQRLLLDAESRRFGSDIFLTAAVHYDLRFRIDLEDHFPCRSHRLVKSPLADQIVRIFFFRLQRDRDQDRSVLSRFVRQRIPHSYDLPVLAGNEILFRLMNDGTDPS